jgi:hypothetical protein
LGAKYCEISFQFVRFPRQQEKGAKAYDKLATPLAAEEEAP